MKLFGGNSSFKLGFLIISGWCFLELIEYVHGINGNGGDGGISPLRISRSVESQGSSNLICIPELMTWGATFPHGDIELKVGGTLEVNCTIDLNNPLVKNLTSKDIEFSFTKHEIPDSQMQVTIIDNSTAMLRVENLNVSTPYLSCSLRRPHSHKPIHVCQNQVNVGSLPTEVENFKCIARNWNSLNCTWNKPRNHVHTRYDLSYKLKMYSIACGRTSSYNKTESCEWNGQTDPHYQPNYEHLLLVMNGSNSLQPEGVLWNYRIKHWSIIIPAKPDRVTTKSDFPHTIEVAWEFENYELFKPGLEHRITACILDQIDTCFTFNYTSHYKQARLKKEIYVPYAYTTYRVEVRMKSPFSNNTEEFWSEPTVSTVQSFGKKPDHPPLVTSGSFEVFNKYQIRDIFVYWQNIQPHLHNGSDFHIEFKVYENGHLRSDMQPSEVKGSFAAFANLSMQSYKFEMVSVNSLGRSEHFSTVDVPSGLQAPPTPTSVTKLYYANGTYEISWRLPPLADNIISYTVYRCNGSRDLPNQCNVLMDWNIVEATQNVFLYHNLPEHLVFQFAVSAATKDMSSDMMLATCELVFDKVPGKITDVRFGESSPSTILVKWNLDCTYKPGQIEGFRIAYCLIKPSHDTCTDVDVNKKEVRAAPADSEYELVNLEPFSRYMIAISILTRAGESQTSDQFFANTTETAPSDPPHVRTIDSTNTSGIIAIEAPINPNGVLKTYKIIYNPADFAAGEKANVIEIGVGDLINASNHENYVNLTNLENNLNYSVTVMACTVSCSNYSDPVFLMTKVGSTKLTSAPSVYYEHDTFVVNWETPSHMGGPIDYFELTVKRNGKDIYIDDPRTVQFISGQTNYEHEVHVACESNTNVSVQVRAVSIVDHEFLFGDWSPEASLSCSGIATWILWVIGLGVIIIIVIIVGILSKTVWKNVQIMKTLDIIFPPGMELNGVPHQVKRRQNSGGDTHSFGKENLTYQLHLASAQTDESKDFLFTDSNKERGDSIYVENSQDNGERHLPLQESIDEVLAMSVGKICDWSWPTTIITSPKTAAEAVDDQDLSCSEFTRTNSLTVGILSASPLNLSSSDHSTTIEDGYSEKRASPSPTNPLLSDSTQDAEADFSGGDDDDLEHYKKLDIYSQDDSHSDDDGRHNDSLGIVEPRAINISIPCSSSEDESQTNQSPPNSRSTEDGSPAALISDKGVVLPEVPNSNPSYIKWAYLKNDPINGEKSLTNAPYYQVGIILDT